MKFKNTIIICKSKDILYVQKYLLNIGYYWIVNGKKMKKTLDLDCPSIKDEFCFLIRNDRSISYSSLVKNIYYYNENYIKLYYPNFLRKEKLKKLTIDFLDISNVDSS